MDPSLTYSCPFAPGLIHTLSTDTPPKSNLETWLETIRGQKMPIFDRTVQRIVALSDNDLAPVSELATVILQDASMTARLLRLANSILYNPCPTNISTVTRAVIVLGFNAVRNLCLTLTLVDTLVKGVAKERLDRELARAMHAATQARAIAAAHGDRSPEEVFIATLLYRIGELAFWCFGNEYCDRVEQLARQPGVGPEQAQERILGFRLSHLSRQLIHEWQLTELLQEAIAHPARQDPRIQSIMLGQQVARCADEHGWRSDQMEHLTLKAAKLTGLNESDARALLHQRARAAAMMASDCGASAAANLIPQPTSSTRTGEPQAPDQAIEAAGAPEPTEAHPLADAKLQIRISRELASALESGRCNFNVIMELVLEGLYRGVGMDRVVFALTTPDKQAIRAKYALGIDDAALAEHFRFARPQQTRDILFQTMDHKVPRLVTQRDREEDPRQIPEGLTRMMGQVPFMVAPIIVTSQCIGLFYADRGLSNRPLDAGSFDDFKHFVHQANLGLTLASVGQHR